MRSMNFVKVLIRYGLRRVAPTPSRPKRGAGGERGVLNMLTPVYMVTKRKKERQLKKRGWKKECGWKQMRPLSEMEIEALRLKAKVTARMTCIHKCSL